MYPELRSQNLVMELDLSSCAAEHPMAPAERVELAKKTTALWVAWGDRHSREALANACWFWEIHRRWFGNLRVEVRLLGDVTLPASLIEACRRRGVVVTTGLKPPSGNKALYDLDRLSQARSVDGSVLYVDTDLYAMRPLPIDKLAGRRFVTFGMGGALTDRTAADVHKIVDEWMGSPSYLYWRDAGLSADDYESGTFWPWLRINLGMFWIGEGSDVSAFYDTFAEHNNVLAYTRYFGLGEMIFTAMHGAGAIPGHEFDWHNGWNKIWPWIKDHDQQVGTIIRDGKVVCLFPRGAHDVIHMSHLGVELHAHFNPMWRKIHMWCEDDGSLMIHVGMVPKTTDSGSFETL